MEIRKQTINIHNLIAILFTFGFFITCVILAKAVDLTIKNEELDAQLAEKELELVYFRGLTAQQRRSTEQLRKFAETRYSDCVEKLRTFQD